MNKAKKKGFTIVELVIVIAVIAILAAVLIPTFTGLINKANLSNDQQAITNMNKISTVENVLNEFDNPSDVVTALYANGWNEGKLSPYSKNYHYAYNSVDRKFYLLNDKDEVVYPESTDKKNLWAFYNNSRNDKVNGINNYIALDNIKQQQYFSEVFNSGEYTIDLYNHYISTVNNTGATIKLINGVVSGSSDGYDVDDTVKSRVDASEITAVDGKYDNNDNLTYTYEGETITKLVIENTIFNLGMQGNEVQDDIVTLRAIAKNGKKTLTDADKHIDVTIKNCTFEGRAVVQNMFPQAQKVIFENCTFNYQGSGYAVEIGGINDAYLDCGKQTWSVAVKNCIIQSVGRGINLSSAPTNKNQRFIFTDNTSIIGASGDNGMALQVAGQWKFGEDGLNMQDGDAAIIEFSNNTLQAAYAAIRVHDELTYTGDAKFLSQMISFSNNTLSEGVQKVILKTGDTNADRAAVRDAWINIFN